MSEAWPEEARILSMTSVSSIKFDCNSSFTLLFSQTICFYKEILSGVKAGTLGLTSYPHFDCQSLFNGSSYVSGMVPRR